MLLKRQIESLGEWVRQKRDVQADTARQIDLTDATLEHVEQSLQGFRGMTEAALGGIAGVIGDALAQYEAVMEQIAKIRLEAVKKTTQLQEKMTPTISTSELAKLQEQMQEIAWQTEKEISKLARKSAFPIPEVSQKRSITQECPFCNLQVSFEMMDTLGQTRVVVCENCGGRFNAHIVKGHNLKTTPLKAPANWSANGALQKKAYAFLRDTQAWIRPDHTRALVSLVVSQDKRMKVGGTERTPRSLQAAIMTDTEKLTEAGIAEGTVRRFFKLAYGGGAFRRPSGVSMTVGTKYGNDLSEGELLRAYVRGCIRRVWQVTPLSPDRAPELAALILQDSSGEAEKLVREAIIERTAQEVISTHGKVGTSPDSEEENA